VKIPTGSGKIDSILEGGLSSGDVMLVYGDPKTGKTTFAIQCAVNCAKKGLKVLFVDCDNSFSVRRLAQIGAESCDRVIEQIVLMRPKDFVEQAKAIDHLSDYVTSNFGLIVFDTISTLYRLRVAESPNKTFDLNRELSRQTALVAQVAKTRKISVLMTSQVRSAFSEGYSSIEPVATRVLKFWGDTIIAMHPTAENSGFVNVELEKIPRSERVFRSLSFLVKIEESGIRDYTSE